MDEIYTDFFGLKERPFSLLPDPEFLYWSPEHKHAATMLEYGLFSRAPITLITGEVGAGKTTLLRHLMATITENVTIALVSNARGSREDLIRWIMLALGERVAAGEDYVLIYDRFQQFLISEYAAGRRVVVVIDEAQNLDAGVLEELRMITNINADKDELVQLILMGQPELRDLIAQPQLRQFAQRVGAGFHLGPIGADCAQPYVTHRLEVAGAKHAIFTPEAAQKVHAYTGGIPRLMNQLCDLGMVYAYSARSDQVTGEIIDKVIEDNVFYLPVEVQGKPRVVAPASGFRSGRAAAAAAVQGGA
ncbi:ExeA family protein [Thioclava indica]|nr:AAA family ATPase [Thioclava indica]